MTDIFYDCEICKQANRKLPVEAEIMIIKIEPGGIQFDLVCKKCSSIKRAKMAEGGKIMPPLQFKPKTVDERLR